MLVELFVVRNWVWEPFVRRKVAAALLTALLAPLGLPVTDARAGEVPQPQVVQPESNDVAQLAASTDFPHPHVDAVESYGGRTYIGGVFDTVVDGAGTHQSRYFAVLDSSTGQVI